jgi:hypothetical protein
MHPKYKGRKNKEETIIGYSPATKYGKFWIKTIYVIRDYDRGQEKEEDCYKEGQGHPSEAIKIV